MHPPPPLLILPVLVLAAGCVVPGGPADPARESLTIEGTLIYPAGVALPPHSVAIVELRDVSQADGAVVAEQRLELAGRQGPIPVSLAVEGYLLDPDHRYALRGAVFDGSVPLLASDPVMVDRTSGVVGLGNMELGPVRAGAFATVFQCGTDRATIDVLGQSLRLAVGADTVELREVVAASGARYEAAGDPSTWFWSKGDRANLVLRGRAFPECTTLDAALSSFRARGNEPGWSLLIDGGQMTLNWDYGQQQLSTPTPAAQLAATFTRYAARAVGRDITVTVVDRLCRDTMTGMPHPHGVEVLLDERRLTGCGGEPAVLLGGGDWLVTAIGGKPVIGGSRATVRFDDEGRVGGSASCNRYSAEYVLSDEGLAVSARAAVTRMACDPALMAQEDRFLNILGQVTSFDIAADGGLVLQARDGRTITARRMPPG